MNPIPLWLIDAFTDKPFAGNPAAVCLLAREVPSDWMQAVAAEMNLSETAFVRRADGHFELRWFTPTVEVDLCGHATLAAAHTLWSAGVAGDGDAIEFQTRSGSLICTREGDWIAMDFPALPVEASAPHEGLLEAIGIASPRFVGRTRFDALIEVASADEVLSLEPDFRKLAAVPTRGVIVTAASDETRYDFVSRFFAPAAGIDEDPVTGSAHCSLAPYWSARLGKLDLIAYQASRRGGDLKLSLRGGRLRIAGQAVTVVRGELLAAGLA